MWDSRLLMCERHLHIALHVFPILCSPVCELGNEDITLSVTVPSCRLLGQWCLISDQSGVGSAVCISFRGLCFISLKWNRIRRILNRWMIQSVWGCQRPVVGFHVDGFHPNAMYPHARSHAHVRPSAYFSISTYLVSVGFIARDKNDTVAAMCCPFEAEEQPLRDHKMNYRLQLWSPCSGHIEQEMGLV